MRFPQRRVEVDRALVDEDGHLHLCPTGEVDGRGPGLVGVPYHPSDRPDLRGGLTWWGWRVPAWLDVIVVLVTGLVLLAAASVAFARDE